MIFGSSLTSLLGGGMSSGPYSQRRAPCQVTLQQIQKMLYYISRYVSLSCGFTRSIYGGWHRIKHSDHNRNLQFVYQHSRLLLSM